MAVLTWDDAGARNFETGVSNVALYVYAGYPLWSGYSWNGVVSITQSPSGGESNNLYADDMKYGIIRSMENFNFTIEAFSYPLEFLSCDGKAAVASGLYIDGQARKPFGLVYKSKIGDDEHPGIDKGYKLHIIYNATANPSEKQYQTINDSPDAITYSWECSVLQKEVINPVYGPEYKGVSHIVIDSTKANSSALLEIERNLFGHVNVAPKLITPRQVFNAFGVSFSL